MAANSSSTVSKPSNSAGGKPSGPSAEQVPSPPPPPAPRAALVPELTVVVAQSCRVKLEPLIRVPGYPRLTLASPSPSSGHRSAFFFHHKTNMISFYKDFVPGLCFWLTVLGSLKFAHASNGAVCLSESVLPSWRQWEQLFLSLQTTRPCYSEPFSKCSNTTVLYFAFKMLLL